MNLLSIDVSLGALCSALFFSKVFGISILPYGLIVLTITVWIIYTVDHLLDARKVSQPASTERHQFHQRHYGLLVKMVWIAIAVNGVLTFFIRKPVLVGGVFLFAGVGVYLLVQQYMKVSKEMVVAFLYTVGVSLPSIAIAHLTVMEWPWVLLAQFFLTALANLVLFAWFDREHDRRDKLGSFVTTVGEKGSRYFIWTVLLIAMLLTFFSENNMASLFILAGDLILLLIFISTSFFERYDRFRLLGDAVFFIPLLYWLI